MQESFQFPNLVTFQMQFRRTPTTMHQQKCVTKLPHTTPFRGFMGIYIFLIITLLSFAELLHQIDRQRDYCSPRRTNQDQCCLIKLFWAATLAALAVFWRTIPRDSADETRKETRKHRQTLRAVSEQLKS